MCFIVNPVVSCRPPLKMSDGDVELEIHMGSPDDPEVIIMENVSIVGTYVCYYAQYFTSIMNQGTTSPLEIQHCNVLKKNFQLWVTSTYICCI